MKYAIKYGNLDCIKYIWSKGFDFSKYYVFKACASGFIEVVEFIHSQCPNFSKYAKETTKKGMNVLMLAAKRGSVDVVNFLIKLRINLEFTNEDGLTAIVLAARSGSLSCVKALVEAGASFNIPHRKYNCFIEAATQGHLDIVKYLLDKGVRIDLVTSDGFDAIKCAFEMKRSSVVQYLLMKGATIKPETTDLAETTPEIYDVMIKYNQIKESSLLVLPDAFYPEFDDVMEPHNMRLIIHLFENYVDIKDCQHYLHDIFKFDKHNKNENLLSQLCKTKGFKSNLSNIAISPFCFIHNSRQLDLLISSGFEPTQKIIVENRIIEKLIRVCSRNWKEHLQCAKMFLEYVYDIELLDHSEIITKLMLSYTTKDQIEYHAYFMEKFKDYFKNCKFDIISPRVFFKYPFFEMIFDEMNTNEKQKMMEKTNFVTYLKYFEKVKYMVNKGCDLRLIDNNKILHLAHPNMDLLSYDYCKKAIDFYIKAGCDINQTGWDHKKPIILVSKLKTVQFYCIQVLLEYGVDPNSEDETGRTALHYCKNIFDIQILLEYGADINKKAKNGNTPLSQCIYSFDIAIYMIQHGAKVSEYRGGIENCLKDVLNFESHKKQTKQELLNLITSCI
ncbi:hypothetical protein TVAG_200600 [Trichomonas vaginalis G3]|uniref:DUF3447 domain-containing protein n=1 Tax=Trichomonas vaginalis (strain ATCC PRA-98 / G3) TaxID=412133 RepID=A2FRZ6_TRIV3|nr:hypothetical protein TVAG_200600 [Trichomonas vaginalis G3]|eukprot:XP_001305254.1 hypothetical protein [Trichomonas vaginalis G3]